jgi:hypothetical protein
MNVYGYARLVGYTPDLTIEPDILARLEMSEDRRVYTMHLRPGHLGQMVIRSRLKISATGGKTWRQNQKLRPAGHRST